jgi:hypothetical protein
MSAKSALRLGLAAATIAFGTFVAASAVGSSQVEAKPSAGSKSFKPAGPLGPMGPIGPIGPVKPPKAPYPGGPIGPIGPVKPPKPPGGHGHGHGHAHWHVAPVIGIGAYAGSCYWLRAKYEETGSRYWLKRYYACIGR